MPILGNRGVDTKTLFLTIYIYFNFLKKSNMISVGIYYGKGVLKIKKNVSLCPKFTDLKLVSIWSSQRVALANFCEIH